MARLIFIVALLAAAAATPARAQFGPIFNDAPPRPPADVPSQPPSQPPSQAPGQPQYQTPGQPQYQPQQQRNFPSANDTLRPPANIRGDVPPAAPLPAPMNLPPQSRPGAGSIQSQPLEPLQGTAPVQPQPPKDQATAPAAPLPGLPPGIRQPRGTAQPSNTEPQPGDEVVVEPPEQKINNPTAVFSGLDKITGRIISFDVAINETVQFGALQVTPRVCYSRPPTETPQTDGFVEVDEVTLQGEIRRIFTGWMFAASPGLHAVEHPIYDVWLTDCKGGQGPAVAEAPAEKTAPKQPAPKQPAPAKRPPPPARTQQQPGFLPALR